MSKPIPEWVVNAIKNHRFFCSEEFDTLFNSSIQEYNEAIKSGDKKKIESWKSHIEKWLNRKQANASMYQQAMAQLNKTAA